MLVVTKTYTWIKKGTKVTFEVQTFEVGANLTNNNSNKTKVRSQCDPTVY